MNVLDALDALGIEAAHTYGEEFVAFCPMHEERTGKQDSSPSWSINVETGLHQCWSCGYSGSLRRVVMDLRGTGVAESDAWLEANDWRTPGDLMRSLRKSMDRALAPEADAPPPFDVLAYLANDPVTEDMAASRGIPVGSCDAFEVRSQGGAWLVPIRDRYGSIVGMQRKRGRNVRNLPVGVSKGRSLFGLRELPADVSSFAVVESPLDVVLAHSRGVPAVPTFGAKVTSEQVGLILAQYGEPVLAMDNDRAGDDAARMLGLRFGEVGRRFREVVWPDGVKDFGDAPDLVSELVRDAVDPVRRALEERGRRWGM